jgi:hypothetical protein
LSPHSLLQYAFVVVGREAAEAAGRAYLKSNPAVLERFDAALAEFSKNGLPSYRNSVGSDLAAVALKLELDLSAGR